MHGKASKRDPIRLKFDTSSDNLACFINARNQLTADKDIHARQTQSTRKKAKPNKEKTFQLKNRGFLESILCKALPEQFAGKQDIKQLVSNLDNSSEDEIFVEPKPSGQSQNCKAKTNKKEAAIEEEDYKILISEWVENPKEQIAVSSTRVGTEETPERSNKLDKNFSESSFSQSLVLPYQTYQAFEMAQYYDQNYYLYQNYPQKQNSGRKKRNACSDQSHEFKIEPQNIEADGRTTLMIRNIPNKYTQDLLLEEFNKNFKVKFDFFYLPIDYNNSCNVGYAFINFIHSKFILSFYNEFNGKKWSKFNSEKICELTYARIQGTGALRNHFKNSHVMQQKDKRFRPLLNELDEEKRNNLSKIVQDQKEKI